MFIDTHCHLNMMVEKLPNDLLQPEHMPGIARVVAQAQVAGVTAIINVGTSLSETYNSCAIAAEFAHVYATAGIHPCDCTPDWRDDFEKIAGLVADKKNHKIVGIGETGLDFYHQPYDAQLQEVVFRAHIELAIEHNLPLIVHVRNAGPDALRILSEYKHRARGVIHCFSLDLAAAQMVSSWGWYIGIDAPITYPKSQQLVAVVTALPLEHILLETDAPFLPPQLYRGKRNSPVYMPLIAEKIAQLKGCAVEEVAQITTRNAKQLFTLM